MTRRRRPIARRWRNGAAERANGPQPTVRFGALTGDERNVCFRRQEDIWGRFFTLDVLWKFGGGLEPGRPSIARKAL